MKLSSYFEGCPPHIGLVAEGGGLKQQNASAIRLL